MCLEVGFFFIISIRLLPAVGSSQTLSSALCFTENGRGCGQSSDRGAQEDEDSAGPAGSIQSRPGEGENGNQSTRHMLRVKITNK